MAMELELGLALPSNPTKGFDLNRYGFERNEPLGSDPFTTTADQCAFKRRCLEQGVEAVPQRLALLLRNDHPNEEDDNAYNELDQNSTLNKSDGDEDGVVGWPPIKSWTRKLCSHQNRGGGGGGALRFAHKAYNCGANNGGGVKSSSSSSYVKVKMEGVAIARKVDLSLHGSYETLLDTLFGMFGRGQENVEDFKLAYQDRDGDWLLAGDVPWSSFVQSVQRLKLVRVGN